MEKFYFTFECDNNPYKMDTNNDGTRHCTECSKSVHDFTRLSAAQFIEFSLKNPKACGFMMPWQPEKINNYLKSQNQKSSSPSFQWAKIAAMVTAPLLTNTSQAQNNKDKTAVEYVINNESTPCTELLLRDAKGNPILDLEFDVFSGDVLLEKIKPDSTGKLSISHTRYRTYGSLRIVHNKYKLEQIVSVQKQPICTIWKIDIDKLIEAEKTIEYDIQFVYRGGRGKAITLTKVQIEFYDSTNLLIGVTTTRTNIGGYSKMKIANIEGSEEIMFTLYTRKGRRTAYLNVSKLKKGEVNLITISKKFRSRMMGAYAYN